MFQAKGRLGLAYIEHTTGEFRVTEFHDRSSLEDELARLHPSEVLYSEEQAADFDLLTNAQEYDGYTFLIDQAEYALKQHFNVQSLDGFGCEGMVPAIGAAGAIIHYVETQLRRSMQHLRSIQAYQTDTYVLIDSSSQANLDLVTSRSGGVKTSLLGAIDRTTTPMGARKLRNWVLHPIRNLETLVARQDLVEAHMRESFLLHEIREAFSDVRDVERTISRLSQGSGNARDLKALESSLRKVPDIREHLSALGGGSLADELIRRLGDFTDLVNLLEGAIAGEPPAALKEGGIFADGYSDAIDELRRAASEGKQWVAELQSKEQERTGISCLLYTSDAADEV